MRKLQLEKTSLKFSLIVFVLALVLYLSQSCKISGVEIGTCQSKSMMSVDSFCYNYISNYVCLPANRSTWNSYDYAYRDGLIEDMFMTNLEKQLVKEYQNLGGTNIISNNINCYYAYRTFICTWNFPQCSSQTGENILLCLSTCQSFFSNCQGNTQICQIVYQQKDLGLDPNC